MKSLLRIALVSLFVVGLPIFLFAQEPGLLNLNPLTSSENFSRSLNLLFFLIYWLYPIFFIVDDLLFKNRYCVKHGSTSHWNAASPPQYGHCFVGPFLDHLCNDPDD